MEPHTARPREARKTFLALSLHAVSNLENERCLLTVVFEKKNTCTSVTEMRIWVWKKKFYEYFSDDLLKKLMAG